MQWYNFFQVIVNIVSSAFAMCKCRLTWDLRLRRYCIKHKHEVLTFGPAFDVSSSQSGTHFWSTTVNLFYWGAIWKPHALLCIYGKVIHRSIGPLHEAFHPMRPLHFILLNSLQARKKIHQSWMGDLQLSFLNRRSYHHQCLRPWGIGCKVCGCLHLSFTSLNTKSKKLTSGTLTLKKCFFFITKTNLCFAFSSWWTDVKTTTHSEVSFHSRMDILRGIGFMVCLQLALTSISLNLFGPCTKWNHKHHIEYRKAIVSGLDSPCCETWHGMAWSTLLQLGIHVCPSKFNLLSDMFHWWRWCTYSWIMFSHARSRGTTHRGWWCVEGGNWTLYIRNWSNCTFPLNLPWMYVLRMWGNSKYESVRRSNRIARRICYLQVTQMLFATDFAHIMRLSW